MSAVMPETDYDQITARSKELYKLVKSEPFAVVINVYERLGQHIKLLSNPHLMEKKEMSEKYTDLICQAKGDTNKLSEVMHEMFQDFLFPKKKVITLINPENNSETWNRRGKKPMWYVRYMHKNGIDLARKLTKDEKIHKTRLDLEIKAR